MEQFNDAQGQVVISPNNKALRVRPMMSFIEAVKTCFKKYANFSGRARRSEFWWYMLFITIIEIILYAVILSTIDFKAYLEAGSDPFSLEQYRMMYRNPAGVLYLIFSIITFIPSLAVQVRRFHDVSKSGKWIILPYILLAIVYIGLSQFIATQKIALLLIMIVAILTLLVFGIIFLVWSCLDSKPQTNKWGASPKYEEVEIDTPMSQQQ